MDKVIQNAYAATERGKPLRMQRSRLQSKASAHIDRIRSILTKIEFEDELDDGYQPEAVEAMLQEIECEIDEVRLTHKSLNREMEAAE